MSGDIYIAYAGVGSVIEELGNSNRAINTILENLAEAIQPLTATWAGDSEQEYIQVQARWNADMTDMTTVLVQATQCLGDISYNTSRTDLGVAGQWAAIR